MDLKIINRHSPRSLAISAIFWSCFGGMELGWGIKEVATKYGQFVWVSSFILGTVFLALGIFWALMLARRAGPLEASSNAPSASR